MWRDYSGFKGVEIGIVEKRKVEEVERERTRKGKEAKLHRTGTLF